MENLHPQTTSSEPKYAQLVSSVVSPYDATLIFYQVQPIQSEPNNIEKFATGSKYEARVVLPLKAAKELSAVMSGQFQGDTLNKGGEKKPSK